MSTTVSSRKSCSRASSSSIIKLQVQPDVAGDDVEFAVAVDVGELDRRREVVVGRDVDATGEEVVGGVAEVEPVRRAERADHEVEPAVVVHVAECDRADEETVLA